MSEYIPDKWIIVRIGNTNLYKIFACWYGGWAGSDSWKLNSGITSVTKDGDWYSFEGASGSIYKCHINSYGTSGYGLGVLSGMVNRAAERNVVIEILDKTVDPMTLIYE
jgi:hypothetical protein